MLCIHVDKSINKICLFELSHQKQTKSMKGPYQNVTCRLISVMCILLYYIQLVLLYFTTAEMRLNFLFIILIIF